ncbi:MAG TPA: COR domain-containing protein [Bryobacteraceae bacterium]|jgi:internalin A|nr:COR domain-containing protein [Bryobacteraceae bacterium]
MSAAWELALKRIEEAKRLKASILYLEGLGLTRIPESIAQLKRLRILVLKGNQLTALPAWLGQAQNLTYLDLRGNRGLGIPQEVLDPFKPREILAYYFAQRTGARPLNEAKLILVGQGGVGKTSLVKALTTGKFNSREKTTEGIKISDWPCPLAKKEAVTIHIWDFGGQEMMHSTHQFFLTARSLYLLVLNRRPGGYDREVDYWMRLIRAFGGKDAPVIIVLNKQKSEPFDVNRGAWLEKYSENIKGFVETDCAVPTTITQLKKKIQEQLRSLNSLKASFPTQWFAIKEELATMATEFVTFDAYREICRKHGEQDPANQTLLAGFLHDLGIALNYKDDRRFLHFAYVLKPEWITRGIYALLHTFVKRNGLFSRTEAKAVLDKKGYGIEAADFILALMEQFELSFPLGDKQNRILIPQLLEDQQPEQAREFKPAECLNFGYQYPIVSEGLLPRFIVRTHHLSEPATRWKSGVILRDAASGCQALVRADAAEGQVRAHINGPEASRRELLAIIRHNFEIINGSYEFKPDDLVYAPGVPEVPVSVQELEALRNSAESVRPIVRPDKTVIKVSVDSLLEPVESAPRPLRLFLSYAHADQKHIEELRKSLKQMERNGLIHPWYDRELTAGERWNARILQELNEADVIVCQISRDFLASDFCVLTELDTAIKRKAAGEAELIAYILHESGWKDESKLKEFQVLPDDAKPISRWKNKHAYWQAVADGIQQALKKLQAQRPASLKERDVFRGLTFKSRKIETNRS